MASLKVFVGDFETTVYKGQTSTEVWASAIVELYTENVIIHHSIDEAFEYLTNLKTDLIIYYHNLKFDGHFWLYYLIKFLAYKEASEIDENGNFIDWKSKKDMEKCTFRYSISDMGQWYTIVIKTKYNFIIEIRDSLKLLPFSVKQIGNSFATKHKKLDMEYTGLRYAGCTITDEEKHYISNDVLVVKEAIEILFEEGHNKLTIGSCCLSEYKRSIGNPTYKSLFPQIYSIPLDKEIYGAENAGEWVRKSYKGGWCYLVEGKENQIKHNGLTADVNSLYPSMMHSESGNRYPIGNPIFWHGNYIPDEALQENKYFFIRIKTRFYIKDNYLPFIQIKNNPIYKSTECLKTSDIYNYKENKYYKSYKLKSGETVEAIPTLTLTMTDYYLLLEHYNLTDYEILDGCFFDSEIGIFDSYIDKYKQIKLESKGAKRTLAKLFLNNLYGKMATNTNSSFKRVELNSDNSLHFIPVFENNKIPGYIPVGSAITSYARNFTIRAAQKNYYGINNRGFIYADTDSIHCDLQPDEIKGLTIHDKNFCCWKLESQWDEAIFVRQKTYIEHVIAEDLQPIDSPFYSIRCAGMPQKCKDLFIESMSSNPSLENHTEEEKFFLSFHRNLTDFKIGLTVPGKLIPKRIPGGILLTETSYELRG